jgi:cell division initiation protein
MQLTPLEITQREFRRLLRGYDPDEVRHFMENVADEVANLQKDLAARVARIGELEERVKTLEAQEESLRNTLVTAQRMTEEIKANAKREADLIIREAEGRAQRVTAEAEAHAKEVAADAEAQVAEAQQEILDLRRQRDTFAATLRSHIQAHLDLLPSSSRREAREAKEREREKEREPELPST